MKFLISPIRSSLYDDVLQIVTKQEFSVLWMPALQIVKNNLLISVDKHIEECLEFDSNGNIIDGFVFEQGQFWYHGKPFSKLLGNSSIATPINPLLYQVSDDFVEVHPFEIYGMSNEEIETFKEAKRNVTKTKNYCVSTLK